MKYLMLIFCFQSLSFARENLFKSEQVVQPSPRSIVTSVPNKAKSTGPKVRSETGNLDISVKNYSAEGSHVVLPSQKVGRKYPGLKPGMVLSAIVEESLFAFPDSKTPIRAKVIDGRLKGVIFLGEATLERNSKRIVVEFKRLIPKSSNEEYAVQGALLDINGLLGIEGEYKTEEAKFFTAEFLAAAAAGFADASIERGQNAYGNYVDAPTMDTYSKKALGSALSKSAERFAEKVRTAPAYSVLEGPVFVKVTIF